MTEKVIKENIEIIRSFLEAKITANEFYKIYKMSSSMKEMCSEYKPDHIRKKYKDFDEYLNKKNWNDPYTLYEIAFDFRFAILQIYNVAIKVNSIYRENAEAMGEMYPDYLSDDALRFLDDYADKHMPEGLEGKAKSKWMMKTAKNLFKYEKKKPEFAQEGRWPIGQDGLPMVFRSQHEEGDKVTYVFVDTKTNKIEKVRELF